MGLELSLEERMSTQITKDVSHVEFLFYLKDTEELFRVFKLWRGMNNCHFRMFILAAIGMDWMWRKLEQGNFR